jgi:hypothetical protein
MISSHKVRLPMLWSPHLVLDQSSKGGKGGGASGGKGDAATGGKGAGATGGKGAGAGGKAGKPLLMLLMLVRLLALVLVPDVQK